MGPAPYCRFWYASSMALAKRKVSVSLGEDLVGELERRRRHRLLVEFLDQFDVERGPVDESLVKKYIGLLG
jgi:hypothetical protein